MINSTHRPLPRLAQPHCVSVLTSTSYGMHPCAAPTLTPADHPNTTTTTDAGDEEEDLCAGLKELFGDAETLFQRREEGRCAPKRPQTHQPDQLAADNPQEGACEVKWATVALRPGLNQESSPTLCHRHRRPALAQSQPPPLLYRSQPPLSPLHTPHPTHPRRHTPLGSVLACCTAPGWPA